MVDDHPSVREALRLMLECRGYECVPVADGAEALTQLNAGYFDVVITDYEMPNMDGLELLASLSSMQARPFRAVILHAGNMSETLALRARTAGAYDVLAKPAEAADVIATVEQAVRGR